MRKTRRESNKACLRAAKCNPARCRLTRAVEARSWAASAQRRQEAGHLEAPSLRNPPAPPAPDQWELGILAGGRCGRVATAGAGRRRRWRVRLKESGGSRSVGAMEGLEGEEKKGCGRGA